MLTCTWAPSTFSGTQIVKSERPSHLAPQGNRLKDIIISYVSQLEDLGISHLLIAQRWWGNAREIEGSSLDCLAITAFIAAHTSHLNLITAIHPGFFEPSVIAKWGATIDNLTSGRWGINVTSGWNLEEFDMYGIDALDHDERYVRSSEFIRVIRGAWQQSGFSHHGKYYQINNLQLEPRPMADLVVYQGGQSKAAIEMAAAHSDWMFLNGGNLEKITSVIKAVVKSQSALKSTIDRPRMKFAVYGIPVCRPTDSEANQVIDDMISRIDPAIVADRKKRTAGAEGMWQGDNLLNALDTNEGYATGLIGSPETILNKIQALNAIGVDMLHLHLSDDLFKSAVLPALIKL